MSTKINDAKNTGWLLIKLNTLLFSPNNKIVGINIEDADELVNVNITNNSIMNLYYTVDCDNMHNNNKQTSVSDVINNIHSYIFTINDEFNIENRYDSNNISNENIQLYFTYLINNRVKCSHLCLCSKAILSQFLNKFILNAHIKRQEYCFIWTIKLCYNRVDMNAHKHSSLTTSKYSIHNIILILL